MIIHKFNNFWKNKQKTQQQQKNKKSTIWEISITFFILLSEICGDIFKDSNNHFGLSIASLVKILQILM